MKKIITPSIPLSDPQEAAISQALESGEYGTEAEVIQSALGLWVQRFQEREAAKERLRVICEEGLASGPSISLDMPALRARVKAKLAESADGE